MPSEQDPGAASPAQVHALPRAAPAVRRARGATAPVAALRRWRRARRARGTRRPARATSGRRQAWARRHGAPGQIVGPGRGRAQRFADWWRRLTPKRAVLVLIGLIFAWLALSLVLFLISSHFERTAPPKRRGRRARPGGLPADLGQQHPRARLRPPPEEQQGTGRRNASGPSRSDTIMLIRTGGGHDARLSIPRDTVVEIPGHGLQKINAAHAFGGPALSISVIKRWLDIPINHVVEVNFENFPQLIDAMGGVDYTGGCVDLADRRRLSQRRLHAAPARGHPPPRRQAGAGAGPHAREPVCAERRPTCSARNTSRRCSTR